MVRIVEFIVTTIFNWLMDLIESFEDSETPKVLDFWSKTKSGIFEPTQRVWDRFQTWVVSGWSFADSLISGVWIPVVDSSVAYFKSITCFGLKSGVELGYQIDIAIISIISPFVSIMKSWPVIGELLVAIESVMQYILKDYFDFELEEGSEGEGPLAFTKDGRPASKAKAQFRSATEVNKLTVKGKPELAGRASLRPESATLPID